MPTDLFGRTTSFGLSGDGTFSYTWTPRDSAYSAAGDSLFHVDGSKVVLPADTTGDDWGDSYVITAPALDKLATASFDVFLPALPDEFAYLPWYALFLEWPDVTAFGDYISLASWIRQDFTFPNTDPHVTFGPHAADRHGNQVEQSIAVELGEWYTLEVSYSIGGLFAGYRFWKRSDPRPADFMLIFETDVTHVERGQWFDGLDGNPWVQFYAGTEAGAFDNLVFNGTYETVPLSRTIRSFITSGQLQVVTDQFDRTVTRGLGTNAYRFLPRDDTPFAETLSTSSTGLTEATAPVSVNGSQVSVAPTAGPPQSAYSIAGTRAASGWLSIDFRTPSSWVSGRPWFRIVLSRDRTYTVLASIQASTPNVLFQVSGGSGSSIVSVSTNTWYTLKVLYDDVGEQQIIVKPQGTPDTSAIYNSTFLGGFSSFDVDDDRIVVAPATSVALGAFLLDNLSWLSAASFTIDAVIVANNLAFQVNAVIKKAQAGSFTVNAYLAAAFTIDAVLVRPTAGSFTLNATLGALGFKMDAFIVDNNALLRHFRERDHTGTLLDTSVVLMSNLGPWPAGTTLHAILVDLWASVEDES
jgi:hypothetical protein